jgi:uncharacterized protein YxeA
MKKIIILTILILLFSVNVGAQEIINTSSFVNSIGYLNVVGEVKNTSSNSLEYGQIIASFLDSEGNVVDTSMTYTNIDIIKPGAVVPFKVNVKNNEKIKQYSLQFQANQTNNQKRNIEIVNNSSNVNSINYLEISGQVKNNTSESQEYVQIVGTFYDENGVVVDVGMTYSSVDVLQPGGTSPFKLTVQNRDEITDYKLQVQ